MWKPHPKGPRVFRSFFEADRPKVANGATKRAEASPLTAPESRTMNPLIPIDSTVASGSLPRIDLTAFAGRVAPPAGVLGAGFDLPSSFFSRLNAAHPADLASAGFSSWTAKS
jgi:hypothetical protein